MHPKWVLPYYSMFAVSVHVSYMLQLSVLTMLSWHYIVLVFLFVSSIQCVYLNGRQLYSKMTPKKHICQGKKCIQILTPPPGIQYLLRSNILLFNFTHLIHKLCHIQSVFTNKYHWLYLHSQCPPFLQNLLPKCHAYLKNWTMDKSQKKRWCQLTSFVLSSLFCIPWLL